LNLNVVLGEFPVLYTERFHLRQITFDDAAELFAIYSDPVAMEFFGMDALAELAQARHMIERQQQAFRESRKIRWAITERGQDQLIGTIGLHSWEKEHAHAEIGYDLNQAVWGQRIIGEVIAPVIEYGFTTMELNRIVGNISPENIASKRILEKAGFHYEGTLRHEMFFNGQFHDTAVYGRLKSDV
jgi:[ribosomal protein S5]-alanine N-acetyltransferase